MNMRKVQFDDVTPPGKKSIRNIPIPSGGKRKSSAIETKQAIPEVDDTPQMRDIQIPPEPPQTNKPTEFYYPDRRPESVGYSQKKSKKPVLLIVLGLVLILGTIGLLMTVFASASVNIEPKTQEVAVDMEIPVTTGASTSTASYEVIKSTKSKTATVQATGEEAVEERASGKIIIYNNYSSEPQRLVTRTRFENPDGLIYRIQEGVVVPGKTAGNPGSIEVEVFADEAGEKYNIKKTDFTIPGFKNDAGRYEGFYARSVTDMEGGFIGNRKTVVPSEKESVLGRLNSELQVEIKKDVETKVPEGLVLLPGATVYEERELAPKESSSSIEIGSEITAYAILMNTYELSSIIANEYVSGSDEWQGINPIVTDFSSLNTSFEGSLKGGEDLVLHITGAVKISADIDEEAIKQLLLGTPRENAANIVEEVAGISRITTILRPVWKQSFPSNPLKIKVQIEP
jgi:hypothetical protein